MRTSGILLYVLTISQAAKLLHPDNSSYRIPLPWATGCTMETTHPVKDGYKYKNTVVFPGACNLFLKFDPRCASQYDYDKVIVYAGDSPKGSKVAEYGGNTYGYVSRSVLGEGWPSQSVKVCIVFRGGGKCDITVTG